MAWLLKVQDLARSCGFFVPQMARGTDGDLVQDGWTCETYFDGVPTAPERVAGLLPRLAAFHRRTAEFPQRPGLAASTTLITEARGGDVDLSVLPAGLAARCRAAWAAVADRPARVIHGDVSKGNLLVDAVGQIGLIDWDECRRDFTFYDTNPIQPGDAAERRAHVAWEIANGWTIEPAYARRLAETF